MGIRVLIRSWKDFPSRPQGPVLRYPMVVLEAERQDLCSLAGEPSG